MTKTATKEIKVCDVCGKEEPYIGSCDECRKDICCDCRKTNAVEYSHGVNASGSGDGSYCLECDMKLRASGKDKRHTAFLRIQDLRAEAKRFYEDFKVRSEAAEQEVRRHERTR